jgi:hypothetical protein
MPIVAQNQGEVLALFYITSHRKATGLKFQGR